MLDTPLARRLSFFFFLLFWSMNLGMISLMAVSVRSLHAIELEQVAHAKSYVPAKRLAAKFEREILNARIFFIYFVTIQKPGSLDSGWVRYRNSEAAVRDLSVLINQQEDLRDLRVPVAKLQADVDTYGVTLAQVLDMVKGGEVKGPHYDEMVKLWAAKGATMVGDAGALESLCFRNGEANSNEIADSLVRGQAQARWLFVVAFLLSLALTFRIISRVKQMLIPTRAASAVAFPDAATNLGAS
jgi:hypothetical protein